jgi:hypothetical protein
MRRKISYTKLFPNIYQGLGKIIRNENLKRKKFSQTRAQVSPEPEHTT